MHQILFEIPLKSISESLPNIPIHGYGLMLFLAFVFCTWLAARLGKPYGISPANIQDMAIWIFIVGIAGARVTYILQYWDQFHSLAQFFYIWDGGLVFYGGAIGGLLGFLTSYYIIFRPKKVSAWKLADVLAPCVALGLCIGRFGCLLNGCCYGGVACVDCPQISFPTPAAPRYKLVDAGYQSSAGFTMEEKDGRPTTTVGSVDPGSSAARAGLRPGDVITEVDGKKVYNYDILYTILHPVRWPRGLNTIRMTVDRDGEPEHLQFVAWTLGLHPTQLYESISTGLLVFLLLAYYPLRRRDGEVIVLLMLGYSVHRYLNEVLRNDTDPVAFGLTLSQNISIVLFTAGLAVGLWLWSRPPQYGPGAPPPEETPAQTPEPVPQEQTAPETSVQD